MKSFVPGICFKVCVRQESKISQRLWMGDGNMEVCQSIVFFVYILIKKNKEEEDKKEKEKEDNNSPKIWS